MSDALQHIITITVGASLASVYWFRFIRTEKNNEPIRSINSDTKQDGMSIMQQSSLRPEILKDFIVKVLDLYENGVIPPHQNLNNGFFDLCDELLHKAEVMEGQAQHQEWIEELNAGYYQDTMP